jgi:hypothetical protein
MSFKLTDVRITWYTQGSPGICHKQHYFKRKTQTYNLRDERSHGMSGGKVSAKQSHRTTEITMMPPRTCSVTAATTPRLCDGEEEDDLALRVWDNARDGDTANVGTLLSTAGAQSLINYQSATGAIPLHLAASNGHAIAVPLLNPVRSHYFGQLIAARCNMDLQANDGTTALYCAAQEGHASVTKQLIGARCNVDLQPKSNGRTSLFIAARCNVDLQMTGGLPAMRFAQIVGHAEIASLIGNKKQERPTPLLGRHVVINGLVAKPELNERKGTAVSFPP